jgi:mRNA interferase MazF
MVKETYIPDKGDIIWINFNPQAGKEQSGHRPALVLSHKLYNQKVGLAILCPITSKEKGYPFEVKIHTKDINGVVLSDHVKSLDWKERNAIFIAKVHPSVINTVINVFKTIIE